MGWQATSFAASEEIHASARGSSGRAPTWSSPTSRSGRRSSGFLGCAPKPHLRCARERDVRSPKAVSQTSLRAEEQGRLSEGRDFSRCRARPHGRAGGAAPSRKRCERIRAARAAGRPVMCAFGAHTIKNGLGPVLMRLIEQGWITHLATNGAGIIHDWELAYQGRTSEDVRANMPHGEFGTWDETGRFINLALLVGAWRGTRLRPVDRRPDRRAGPRHPFGLGSCAPRRPVSWIEDPDRCGCRRGPPGRRRDFSLPAGRYERASSLRRLQRAGRGVSPGRRHSPGTP